MKKIRCDATLFGAFYIFHKNFCEPNNVRIIDIANHTGIKPVYFTHFMRGKSNIPFERALKISDYFKISPEILLSLIYIQAEVDKLINSFPELENYQHLIYEIINETNFN